MKKIFLTFIVASALVACKQKAKNSTTEIFASADSAALHSVTNRMEDSIVPIVQESANKKILDLENEKEFLDKKFKTEIDSAAKQQIVNEIKTTQEKIDSTKQAVLASIKNIKKPVEKIIKETKVIYKETPKPKEKTVKIPAPQVVKTGILEFWVDNVNLAKQTVKQQVMKYDGIVQAEQINVDKNRKTDDLKIIVATEKSDYLIADLEQNVGNIQYKNIEITGTDFRRNDLCQIHVTLSNDEQKTTTGMTSQNSENRTFAAIASGWNVIEEIFYFLLPFWPVFLIGGGIILYLKSRKQNTEHQENI